MIELTAHRRAIPLSLLIFALSGCVIPNPNYHEDAGDSSAGGASDTDSNGIADTNTDTELDTVSYIDTNSDTDTDTDTDTYTDTDTDTDSDTDADADSDSDSDSDTDSDTDTDTDTDSDIDDDTSGVPECSDQNPCEDDGLTCTDEVCQSGKCISKAKSSYCLIAGKCYKHNQNDPGNDCSYCDATLNNKEWTNWSRSMDCDDGLWCNGEDNCDGSGGCNQHEYPDDNRCDYLDGDCILITCDDETDTCFSSNNTVCDSSQPKRCSSIDTCGARVEQQTITQYCSGTSSDCDGEITTGDWESVEQCGNNEMCTGESLTCESTVECNCTAFGNWYDTDTGLCWQNPPADETMSWDSAVGYCDNGDWGGVNDWRMPNIDELISINRGCKNSLLGGSGDKSLCTMTPSGCTQDDNCSGYATCGSCDYLLGPDIDPDGCYWIPDLSGTCSFYWSSSSYAGDSSRAWGAYFAMGYVHYGYYKTDLEYIRCVRGGV